MILASNVWATYLTIYNAFWICSAVVGFAENCDIIITAKIISGLVPKARYKSDPIICWKYDHSSDVACPVLGKGL